MKKVKCPKCQSTNCYAYNNAALDHSKEWLKEAGIQNDGEIYIMFKCDDCNFIFNESFHIVSKD